MINTREFLLNKKYYSVFFWGLIIIRSFFNYVLPLTDKTEARYADIARIMSETGNWIIPHIEYGVKFLAKPPLSIWSSAISIYFFGENVFFVRLPYLLLAVFTSLFLGKYNYK